MSGGNQSDDDIQMFPQEIAERILNNDEQIDIATQMVLWTNRDDLITAIRRGVIAMQEAIYNTMTGLDAAARGSIEWIAARGLRDRWRRMFIASNAQARARMEEESDDSLRVTLVCIFTELGFCTTCISGKRYVTSSGAGIFG